jgi:hypothetical protein
VRRNDITNQNTNEREKRGKTEERKREVKY